MTVEQPSSSRLIEMPYLRLLLDSAYAEGRLHYKRFWLGLFGHVCPKASWLLGSPKWIDRLNGVLSKDRRAAMKAQQAESGYQMVNRYVDAAGVQRVCGGRHMKDSATYPEQFADFIAGLHAAAVEENQLPEVHIPEEDLQNLTPLVPPMDWHHADLGELRAFLRAEIDRGHFVPVSNLPL